MKYNIAIVRENILILSPMARFSGGAVRSMYQLVINLKNNGYNPIVVLPESGEIETELKKKDITTRVVAFDWWIRGAEASDDFDSGMVDNTAAISELIKIITQEKPIVCITYTVDAPWLAYASTICGVPHLCQVCEDISDKNWQTRLPVGITLSIMDSLSDKIFANSDYIKHRLLKYTKKNRQVDVIYPYVDQGAVRKMAGKKLTRESRLKKREGFHRFVIVGAILPSKGQLDAVKALNELRRRNIDKCELYIVGGGKDKEYLEKIKTFINDNHLEDRVIFTREVSNPHPYVKSSDIALVCSTNEAFGRVTVEAMSIGVPVIGADSGGTKEIIGTSGERGLIYKTGEYKDLANKMGSLLSDTHKMLQTARTAQKHITQFSLKQCQAPILNYLQTVRRIKDEQDENLFSIDLANVTDKALLSLQKELEFHKRIAAERLQSMELIKQDIELIHNDLKKIRKSKSYKVGRVLASPLKTTKLLMRKRV